VKSRWVTSWPAITPSANNPSLAVQQSFPFGGELLSGDGSALLIPEFLSEEIADRALTELLQSDSWEQQTLLMYGSFVDEPRLSTWHSEGQTYTYSGSARTPQPWTPLLRSIREQCERQTAHSFNGVLVNFYRDGNDHLGWHSDDELINGSEPLIASISLGAERRFDMRHRESGKIVSTPLRHGSLLVMSGLSQRCWEHRIPKIPRLADARVNLTFRRLLADA
jgi:alkylated DNA repair dioxygenase AlkB